MSCSRRAEARLRVQVERPPDGETSECQRMPLRSRGRRKEVSESLRLATRLPKRPCAAQAASRGVPNAPDTELAAIHACFPRRNGFRPQPPCRGRSHVRATLLAKGWNSGFQVWSGGGEDVCASDECGPPEPCLRSSLPSESVVLQAASRSRHREQESSFDKCHYRELSTARHRWRIPRWEDCRCLLASRVLTARIEMRPEFYRSRSEPGSACSCLRAYAARPFAESHS